METPRFLDNWETRYAAGGNGPKHQLKILDKETQEIAQIVENNIIIRVNAEQTQATERANYLEGASSQFKTVKVPKVKNQRNCCCNIL